MPLWPTGRSSWRKKPTSNESSNHNSPRTSRDVQHRNEPEDTPADSRVDVAVTADSLRSEKCSEPHILSRIDAAANGQISSLAFFAGGRRVAAFREGNNKICLWSVEDARLVSHPPIELGDCACATVVLAASNDGKHIANGHDDGEVVIWNTETRARRRVGTLAMKGKITALDISPGLLRIASGSDDGTVAIWSVERGELLLGPLGQQGGSPVTSLKFSPAGGRLASTYLLAGTDRCSVRIWHSRSGTQLGSILAAQRAYSLAWSADSRWLFVGFSGWVQCFDVSTQTLSPKCQVPFRDCIKSLCLSHNTEFLISVSLGNARIIDVWDIRNIPFGNHVGPCGGVHFASTAEPSCNGPPGVEAKKLTVHNLSTVIDSFHRFFPLTQSVPLIHVSNAVHEALKNYALEEAEEALSKEIKDHRYQDTILYGHATRALVRFRRENRPGALEDVDRLISNGRQTPLMAHIVNGVVLYRQGDIDEATRALDIALRDCDSEAKDFFQCIKTIVAFDIERPSAEHAQIDARDGLPNTGLARLVRAWKRLLRADRHMNDEDYEKVLSEAASAPDLGPLLYVPEVKSVSLIFGWDLRGLVLGIHKLRCQALFELQRTPAPRNYFSASETDLSEELEVLLAELSLLSEEFGDKASIHRRYKEAVEWYAEALVPTECSLGSSAAIDDAKDKANSPSRCLGSFLRCPRHAAHLSVKRSEVEIIMGQWKAALTDATWAIDRDSLYPLGYKQKYEALHGNRDFKEACDTLRCMSDKFSNAEDTGIRELLKNYHETLTKIDQVIAAVFDASPFVLIHIADGCLYNQTQRIDKFKQDLIFHQLVSSAVSTSQAQDIEDVVQGYFRYVMFSHRWDESETSFEEVSSAGATVYTHGNEKLRKFCEMVRKDDECYRWSWSDTCCINKKGSDYEKSIRAMFKWYSNSALTLVRLAHPSKSDPRGSTTLEHNEWMFRAWTLQELLAPQVIRFYDHNWDLYLHDQTANHKTSPAIKEELARVTGVEPDALVHFSPKKLPVRQRLRLASTRKATVEVDIAYSLIGIFSSDVLVEYTREPDVALGHLLQERINRNGDVTVLDWVGKPSNFHPCLPAKISVYSQPSYTIPSLTDDDWLNRRVEELKKLPKSDVTQLYKEIVKLPLPRFTDRRLTLPCITFSVNDIRPDTSVQDIYVACTLALGNVKFKTKEDMSLYESPQTRVVLVYPWIRDLLNVIRDRGGDVTVYARALRLLAYLGQGFRAMLFAEESHQQYKRLAVDEFISVKTYDCTYLEDIGIEVLEIWETS